ncbi:hypothetical protein [uncultured Shimia sp.]|uniref:hypothetical protein n=1 Tax=uncultured Shimia sp. TaxID=573152 RepID=UPI00262347CE|nr:hypothetical protein [uncultured Shimia sp.]
MSHFSDLFGQGSTISGIQKRAHQGSNDALEHVEKAVARSEIMEGKHADDMRGGL